MFQTGDYDTKKLLDAKTAIWVIGGKLATFDDILKAAENEQEDEVMLKDQGGHKK